MTKDEIHFFERLTNAMVDCSPLANGFNFPKQTVGSIIKFYSDFYQMNNFSIVAITNYLYYAQNKKDFKNDCTDKVADSLAQAYKTLSDFENFVDIRTKAQWK